MTSSCYNILQASLHPTKPMFMSETMYRKEGVGWCRIYALLHDITTIEEIEHKYGYDIE
jgi:hypothetical protein